VKRISLLFFALIPISVSIAPASLARSAPAQTAPAVPPEYQSLATSLQAALDSVDPGPPAPGAATRFGAELFLANSNRGEALLGPYAFDNIPLALDRMKALGLAGVTVTAHEDVLVRSPRAAEFAAFYRRVAEEVRARGLRLLVETQTSFAEGTTGITFDQHLQNRRRAVEVILTEMQPDYLAVAEEPDTEAALTGFPELATLDGYAAFLSALLDGLPRGTTLIGAGTGSWAKLEWSQRFVQLPIDFLNVHIYPINRDFLPRVAEMAAVARQAGKRAIIGEAWLFKATDAELLWATPNYIFRRDAYSFWQPLDQQFLKEVVDLARAQGFEYASAYWSQYLFAYLDYAVARDYSYAQTMMEVSVQAMANIRAGVLSPTGQYYADLIAPPSSNPTATPVPSTTPAGSPTPAPSSTPTPAPTTPPAASPTAMASPTATASPIATAMASPTATASPIATAMASPTATASPAATGTTTPGVSLPAPSNLVAAAVSSSQVNLAWTDNSADEWGFKIERATDRGTFYPIAIVGADATSYTDTGPGLRGGRTYLYRVRAYRGFANSPYSNTASATTPR
jgi:hypothetical protein